MLRGLRLVSLPVDLTDDRQRYRVTSSSRIPNDLWAPYSPYKFGGCFSAEQARRDGFHVFVTYRDGSGDRRRLKGEHSDGRKFDARVLRPGVEVWA